MISTEAIRKALRWGDITPVLENKEAILYYAENGASTSGNNYDLELKPGEYIAVSKEIKEDVWTAEVQNSTKGNFKRAKKAFEKYSPETMNWMRR